MSFAGSLGFRCGQIVLFALALVATVAAPAQTPAPVHSPGKPYAAKGLADRIVLSPGTDPSRAMAVAFRTDVRQAKAEAEIAPAIDGPTLGLLAKSMTGSSSDIATENGSARYHQVHFTGLSPDTAYVYRVRGADGWSEWLQFRTAAAELRPFTFLFFGDAQNNILPVGSRVVRQAFHATASPALALHAGDLVNQRETMVHDDEWGEWSQAGGHHYATVPQIPAAGNHEFVDVVLQDGRESRRLGPHWPRSFAIPGNGADPVKATTYFVDYQGVRFIVLDGTSAIDLGALDAQTRWLEGLLATRASQWTVVLFHQPIFTCSRPDNTEALKAAWQPVFERHRVDVVLQGHDHCYARLTSEQGKAASSANRQSGNAQGPVYVVTVAGSKMYGLNDRAETQPDRAAEDTQLYQVIDVAEHRLAFRAYTATGRPYDGFDLVRSADGRNRLVEAGGPYRAARRCTAGTGPDGLPCTAEPK